MSPQRQTHKSGLTAVATVSGIFKAEVLKSQLQDAGIDAMLDYESAGVLYGITIDGLKLSQVRILVLDEQAEQARQVLNTPPAPGWEEEATSSSGC
jgi:hypothetical protein